jgi:hypothetical protein
MNQFSVRYFQTRSGTLHIIDERVANQFIKGLCGLRMHPSAQLTTELNGQMCRRCEDWFHGGSYRWTEWSYEGQAEFSFSGYEGTTILFIKGKDGQEDLIDALAEYFAKDFRNMDYWDAQGQLKITVELVKPFTTSPGRPANESLMVPEEEKPEDG